MVPSWSRLLSKRTPGSHRPARPPASVALRLEWFEDRVVPAFFPTTYAAGTGPADIITSDFRQTGRIDVAVANITSNNVSVFLNKGDGTGTFAPAVNYPAGPGPVFLAAVDLNGDGLPDIAAANAGGTTVTVLFNNPANPGTFLPPVGLNVGDNVITGVALADLNGDGFNDIVTANYSPTNPEGSLSVLLNNPANPGTFSHPTLYTAGIGPYALAVADFYGDGLPSVAVSDAYSSNVLVLRDNPANPGTLQAAQNVGHITGGAFITGLAAGDLGTGLPSLVTANNDGAGVSVLLNHGGVFAAPVRYAAGTNPLRVTIADFNGDGSKDVLAANFGGTSVSLLLNNGDGTLQPAQNIVAGSQPSGVVVADLQAGGFNDIIVSNFASNNITVLRQDIPGVQTPGPASGSGGAVVQGQSAVGAEGRADPFAGLASAALGLRGPSGQPADGSAAQSDTPWRHVAAHDDLFADPVMGGLT
jgi:hypothetical protein